MVPAPREPLQRGQPEPRRSGGEGRQQGVRDRMWKHGDGCRQNCRAHGSKRRAGGLPPHHKRHERPEVGIRRGRGRGCEVQLGFEHRGNSRRQRHTERGGDRDQGRRAPHREGRPRDNGSGIGTGKPHRVYDDRHRRGRPRICAHTREAIRNDDTQGRVCRRRRGEPSVYRSARHARRQTGGRGHCAVCRRHKAA